MITAEIYWDEDDDWGRHSYYDTYSFESHAELVDHLEAMRKCEWCYNIAWATIGDDEDDRPM